jgi:hypothetical protein
LQGQEAERRDEEKKKKLVPVAAQVGGYRKLVRDPTGDETNNFRRNAKGVCVRSKMRSGWMRVGLTIGLRKMFGGWWLVVGAEE